MHYGTGDDDTFGPFTGLDTHDQFLQSCAGTLRSSEASMKRAQKAERIALMLDTMYPETPVPLDHTDAYTLLIAVLLSAQSTDKKVNEITPALFARE